MEQKGKAYGSEAESVGPVTIALGVDEVVVGI